MTCILVCFVCMCVCVLVCAHVIWQNNANFEVIETRSNNPFPSFSTTTTSTMAMTVATVYFFVMLKLLDVIRYQDMVQLYLPSIMQINLLMLFLY